MYNFNVKHFYHMFSAEFREANTTCQQIMVLQKKNMSYIWEISINLNIGTTGRLEGVYEVKVEIMPCRGGTGIALPIAILCAKRG